MRTKPKIQQIKPPISDESRFMLMAARMIDGCLTCKNCGAVTKSSVFSAKQRKWQIGAYSSMSQDGRCAGGTIFAPTCPTCVDRKTSGPVIRDIGDMVNGGLF